jgi:hypothetical protein
VLGVHLPAADFRCCGTDARDGVAGSSGGLKAAVIAVLRTHLPSDEKILKGMVLHHLVLDLILLFTPHFVDPEDPRSW